MLHVIISYFNIVRPIKETLFVSNNFYRTTTMILFHSEKKEIPESRLHFRDFFIRKNCSNRCKPSFLF